MIDFLSSKHKIKGSFVKTIYKRKTRFEIFDYIALHQDFLDKGK